MLDKILGSETALKIFLHLYHHGETYATAIAKDFKMSLSQVQRQLLRFEEAGVIVSRRLGKTRVYTFNSKQALVKPFREMVQLTYESLSLKEKEAIFSTRRRPRHQGKPVVGRSAP